MSEAALTSGSVLQDSASPSPAFRLGKGGRKHPCAPSLRDLYHDLPELLSPLQPLECRARLTEGEHPIDDRSQLARAEQAHNLAILGVVAHGGAQDAPLIPEQPADVEPDLGPRRPPAAHEPATASQRAE